MFRYDNTIEKSIFNTPYYEKGEILK